MATTERAGKYVYLTLNPVTNEWREAGIGVKAEEILGANHNDVIYVKVPLRSWDPRVRRSVTVTRVRTIRVEDADRNEEGEFDLGEAAPE